MGKKVTRIAPNSTQCKAEEKPHLNVCAYARVSTGSKAQAESYAAQVEYYTKLIENNPVWNFAGIYADGGITGTKIGKRDEFREMIFQCEEGNINLILTKSITRFCRNTVDCIKTIRKLKAIGVGIYFEKEDINTLTEKSELLITVLSSIAQGESEDFSGNNRWGIIKRFTDGTFIIGMPAYGYENDENGNLIPNEEEAETVRFIFTSYLNGMGSYQIAKALNDRKIPTKRSAREWNEGAVKEMLRNQVYEGDMLYQKTYTAMVFPYEKKTNHGERNQYFIEDDHPAIISREQAQAVREITEFRRRTLHNAGEKGQNRYIFSSRIYCEECGSNFRRQKINIGTPHETIQWCCNRHIRQKELCSNKSIKEMFLHRAFVQMWNKLYTNQGAVLEPYAEALKKLPLGEEEKEQLDKIDNQISELSKQEHILNQVMGNGYMEPAIFMEKKNMVVHSLSLMKRKKAIMLGKQRNSRELAKTEQLIGLLKEKGKLLQEFEEPLFDMAVEMISITKGHDITFHLKNGLKLIEKGDEQDAVAYANRV